MFLLHYSTKDLPRDLHRRVFKMFSARSFDYSVPETRVSDHRVLSYRGDGVATGVASYL